MTALCGKAWVYGDKIDTDLLAPGPYMKAPLTELASHCLEAIDKDFAHQVAKGDVLVAGDAFGIGSSREQAAQVLVELGVSAVVAKSFARIFYRNALNLGLPVLFCPALANVEKGDIVSVDPVSGSVVNQTKAQSFQCEPIPEELMKIVNAGGLMPFLKGRFTPQ
ncbi:3-isopropylmalate dehydratase small subunit [Aestuariibacter sp. A3R04]|uniref:LeuD/DmdB family oxidoreductase small subunit n=1 Tax=Aestuariibacter sp. A3R04 TaxID=2841571 RepID=UPI001C08DA16|nr:3-isopropylmalate dehydratase small subunit [Aestuariibacter sp. A3R04]MBU3023515.1 3-isopropylmalate dehydratase small subunit [Aestuariibacter sp. A3R04]